MVSYRSAAGGIRVPTLLELDLLQLAAATSVVHHRSLAWREAQMRDCLTRLGPVIAWGAAHWLLMTSAFAGGEAEVIGQVAVDKRQAKITFQAASKDERQHLVTLAIDASQEAARVRADRIQVWVLTQGFDTLCPALVLDDVWYDGVRPERGDEEAFRATAVYSFRATYARAALSAIVVAVDGEPKLFQLPPPRK